MAAGYCKFESLKDGTVRLIDVALMNDMIDVSNENRRRIDVWKRRQNRG